MELVTSLWLLFFGVNLSLFDELEFSAWIDATPDGCSVIIRFCEFADPLEANEFIAWMTEGMDMSNAPSSESIH